MADPAFGIFDSDNHYYEPRDTFRHLDPAMADRAVRIVTFDLVPGHPGLLRRAESSSR